MHHALSVELALGSRHIPLHYEVQMAQAAFNTADAAYDEQPTLDLLDAWQDAQDALQTAVERAARQEEHDRVMGLKLLAKGRARPMPVAPHERPHDNGGRHDRSKAVEYAAWLAQRDGIRLHKSVKGSVTFKSVQQSKGGSIERAASVRFGNVTIDIPHVDYDPTRSPKYWREKDGPETAVKRSSKRGQFT